MNNIDFISLYHSYVNEFVNKIVVNHRAKLSDLEKDKLFIKFTTSPFIAPELQIKLENKIKKAKVYDYIFTLKINNKLVDFHFISDKKLRTINNLAKHYFFVTFLQLNSGKKLEYLDNIFINIITVDVPKKLSVPITIGDINSASTEIHNDSFGGSIFIWRNDELEKVLVHEALHSFLYDYDIINQKLIPPLKQLEDKIDKNGKGLNINEAYTELCASFIMCLFKLSKKVSKTNAKEILNKELKTLLNYSLTTCAKLFQKYDIEDIQACTNIDQIDGCKYHQQASAFSYLVIKTALLWTILKNCRSKVRKYTDKVKCLEDFLGIGFTGRIGESYQDIIVRVLKNEKFNNAITKKMTKKFRGRPEKFYFSIFH